FKVTGNICLKRKLVQDRFTEGVDRLDLPATRRLQCSRKKLPRAPQLRATGPLTFEFLDLRRQLLVCFRAPFCKIAKDAVGHTGSRSTGIGQEQNLGWVRAPEQEPDRSLRQEMGFSRTGIGRDPG